jgi:hypothetical protein
MAEKLTAEQVTEVRERVHKFHTLKLPGQPLGMHMGTSYLVNDLDRIAVAYLELLAEYDRLVEAARPFVEWADGVPSWNQREQAERLRAALPPEKEPSR